jgi:cell division protein FtsW
MQNDVDKPYSLPQPNVWLLLSFLLLLSFGIVMVSSASVAMGERLGVSALFFLKHHIIYVALGLLGGIICSCLPLQLLARYTVPLLLASIFLLAILLLPGVSRPINGSIRWLFFGPISFQPSEIAKLVLIIYIAGYMVRRNEQLQKQLLGFFIPLFVLSIITVLLILEPDFGSVVILTVTILGMLFLGGVHFNRFLALVPIIVIALALLTVSSSYRLQRLLTFTDPWNDPFKHGYQLVQSLLAIGRGSLWGTGLGGSVQKLLYLPEAHADFIFAIIAEELGLCGALIVIGIYGVFIYSGLRIGKEAYKHGLYFASYIACGITMLLALQILTNLGVTLGLLPTKGLTLPLLSYGGSSMLAVCSAVGLLFRVDFETQLAANNDR